MPIDETVTDGIFSSTSTSESSTTNPTTVWSEAVVEGIGKATGGRISLQLKTPNGNWITITSKSNAYPVITPDLALEYRFHAKEHIGSGRVYFGP